MSRSRKLADLLDANGDVKLSNLDNSTALPLAGGAMTGAITTNSTFDGVDIATRDGILSSTTTTANAALPKAGGAMTGAVTTNSTFDGRNVSTDGTKLDGIAASANNYVHPNHSGDVTSTADGATVIGNDKVVTAMILNDNVTADKLANSINTDIATGVTANTTANAALPKSGGAMTGAITTNSTFDGVDIATRDAVLTSTTTTASAALPKAGGTMTGDTLHGDNVKAKFGTGNDLEMYHDGSASYIRDVGTGNLLLSSDGAAVILQTSQGEKCVEAVKDGAVNLYQNNSQKFETTPAGVYVTGHARGTLTTDNDGSFDMSASNHFKCTPAGNFALTFTNIAGALSGNILFINSGGHTISAHANTKVDANLLATISTAGTYLLSYFSDGTNVYMTNSAVYT